jgi:hypothetical protein
MDLSRNGCRLRVGEDLPRSSDFTVLFERSATSGQDPLKVEVPGNVIWSRLEGLSYQVGIQFTTESDGLDDILNSLG